MKRLISALLISTLLLVGCENVSYQEESSQSQATSADIFEQLESQLPSINESGDETYIEKQEFIIATDAPKAFYQDETTAGSISTAIEERNTFLEYNYGADITIKEISASDLSKELKAAYEAGQQYCDMISVSAKETVKLYKSGLLADMNSLPEFNLESEFFDERIAKSLATNSTLYLLPDPSALVYEEAYAMFYNRQLVTNAVEYDLESLAMQGKWTWDRFHEVTKVYASSSDIEKGKFGFAAYYTEGNFPHVMWASAGKKLIDNTYKNPVTLSISTDDMIETAKNLRGYYNTNARLPLNGNDAATAFESGRIAFFCNKLNYLYALRDGTEKGSEYGVLPIPKYTEEQENYHCIVDSEARVLSVPITISHTSTTKQRFVSLVISATCAVGGKTIHDAYIDSLLALYLNNNSETVMVKTICDSITFDFAVIFGENTREINRATSGAVADYIDYGSGIKNSLSMYLGTFNKYVKDTFK